MTRRCSSSFDLRTREFGSIRRCKSLEQDQYLQISSDCSWNRREYPYAQSDCYVESVCSQSDEDKNNEDQDYQDSENTFQYNAKLPTADGRSDELEYNNFKNCNCKAIDLHYIGSKFSAEKLNEEGKKLKLNDFTQYASDHIRTASYSNQMETGFVMPHRDAVHSSYPLLRENVCLLQKLRRERDFCRELENDMRDLEGQIQDVTKSFDISEREAADHKEHIKEDFVFKYQYSSDIEAPSIVDLKSSVNFPEVKVFQEDLQYEPGQLDSGHRNFYGFSKHDFSLLEGILSQLLALAEKLEGSIRERDREMLQLKGELFRSGFAPGAVGSLPSQWLRSKRSRELSSIPKELNERIMDLQQALKFIFSRETDRDCSSVASFTFETSPRIFVPTTRTIFSPVGDSVEMRPVVEKDFPSSLSSDSSRPPSPLPQEMGGEEEENPKSEEILSLGGTLEERTSLEPNVISPQKEASSLNEDHYEKFLEEKQHLSSTRTEGSGELKSTSSDVIKRIERLQELVRPELCSILTERALKIQKAKEQFLSDVKPESSRESSPKTTSIVVEEIIAPNGLTVKTESSQPEEKRIKFSFMRKKKRESIIGEEICRDSQVLEEKSDWIRNPFRPRGKYKINNK